jgi:hypothetical protein
MKAVAALAAVSLLAVSTPASAQPLEPSGCESRRPSDSCEAIAGGQAVVIVAEPPAETATATDGFVRRGPPRTHGVAFATGHLLEVGTFQFSARAYGFFSQLAVGLHERIELSADVIGFGLFGAGIGARASLTPPESRLRAVVGAKLWTLAVSPIKPVQLGATLGVQSDRLNFHANVSEMPTDDGRLWLGTVGAHCELSEVVSIGVDAGRIAVDTNDELTGVIAGVKLTGHQFDMDIVVAANDEGALPMLGFTGRL